MRNTMMKTVFALSAVLFVRTSGVRINTDTNDECPPGFYFENGFGGVDYCQNWCVFVSLSLMYSLVHNSRR